MKHFHNTTGLKGAQLIDAIRNAKKQGDAVLMIFKVHKKPMTPAEVHRYYKININNKTPITSIRRAISNLTDKNKLIKTADQKVEQYGMKNHLWKLA